MDRSIGPAGEGNFLFQLFFFIFFYFFFCCGGTTDGQRTGIRRRRSGELRSEITGHRVAAPSMMGGCTYACYLAVNGLDCLPSTRPSLDRRQGRLSQSQNIALSLSLSLSEHYYRWFPSECYAISIANYDLQRMWDRRRPIRDLTGRLIFLIGPPY